MKILKESKPGYLTTEFWLIVIAEVLTQTGAIPIPDKYKWISATLAVIGYAISRGLAKLNVPYEKVLPQVAADPTDTKS